MKSITLAGGCFWGVQKYFQQFEGILYSEVGYANGDSINPTYEEVCDGSNHAEVVHLFYDSNIISLEEILNYYYQIIDVTAINKQGNDSGIQYRTGVYYEDPADRPLIESSLQSLTKSTKKDITIEVMPLLNYYRAEDEHQNYLNKNPNGYCHIPIKMFNLTES